MKRSHSNNEWEGFFEDKMIKIFSEKESVLDIGGGLRVLKEKNNRYAESREWLREYVAKVDYKVLDPVDTFHPDIVGDIHALPLADNSQDAILCMAVLEHVENPIQAMKEMYRVLKPGGYCFIYVPFLYYYHAEKGYYGDYWRFTKDSLAILAKPFSHVEIGGVRGALETWIKLSPLGRSKIVQKLAHYFDVLFGKLKTDQVSGYNVFLVK